MNAPNGKRRTSFGLGLTIPSLLAILFAAEVGLRTVPIERFAFRAWEALLVRHVPGVSGAPLLPSKGYRNDRTYGDLAAFANLRGSRHYRREIFTTDAFGYRNPPESPRAAPPVAMLVGDSFGMGAGAEDSETLPAHLSRLWERRVYNASGMTPTADLTQIRRLAQWLRMSGGVVLYEYLERKEAPLIPGLRASKWRPTDWLEMKAKEDSVFSWDLSRLRILASQMYRIFQDDRILPNPYARNASMRRLANGAEMLFASGELEASGASRLADASYWLWLEQQLRTDGFRLIVILVPNKSTVYVPLLSGPTSQNSTRFDYLDRLERELSKASVPVVNLKGVFRERAARDLKKDSYLYWLDDTHWNGQGMRLAAEETDRVLRQKGLAPPQATSTVMPTD